MLRNLRPALVLVVLFTAVTGLAFPLGFVAVGHALLPFQSGGSLIERGGKVVGSAVVGQSFSSDRYFASRPSATSDADPKDPTKTVPSPDNAQASAGSNLAPTSKTLVDRVTADAGKMGPGPVPSDAVTTSASGLDPHVTPANAERQVARVAAARKLPEDQVRGLLAEHTAGRFLGFIGEPRVNVLALNIALDNAGTTGGKAENGNQVSR